MQITYLHGCVYINIDQVLPTNFLDHLEVMGKERA